MSKIKDLLFKPVDISSIVFFRIGLGLILLWEIIRYFRFDFVRALYIEPEIHFTYDFFHWLSPWPAELMYIHFFILGLSALFIAIGLFYRFSIMATVLGLGYVLLLDKTNYFNHTYFLLLICLLMSFIPANGALAVDNRIKTNTKKSHVPGWMLGILMFQVAVVYLYGAIAKLSVGDWFAGEPMRTYMGLASDFPGIGAFFLKESWVQLFTWSIFLIDLLIVPFLLLKRTRLVAFVIATLFHFIQAVFFEMGMFPWIMMLATTLFLAPDWFRDLLEKRKILLPSKPKMVSISQSKKTVIISLIGVYAIIQLIVPLRHFLYEGPVMWTEQGQRFSWHTNTVAKINKGYFYVKNNQNGNEREFKSTFILTPRQAEIMPGDPDMILQYTRFVKEKCKELNLLDIQVRSEIITNVNNRPWLPFIKRDTNLLEITAQTPLNEWILPLPDSLRNISSEQIREWLSSNSKQLGGK